MSGKADGGRPAVLEVRYGEGWNAPDRTVVGPVSEAEARRRDRAGEQYAVVLTEPGRPVPYGVLHVAWRQYHLGVWAFDDTGRRNAELDLRLLEPGRLFHRYAGRWRYDTPDTPEFDANAWRWARTATPGRGVRERLEPEGDRGGALQTMADVPEDKLWSAAPEFGDWTSLIEAGGGTDLRVIEPVDATPSSSSRPPWSPPVLREPRFLTELFTPGVVFSDRLSGGVLVTTEPETAGRLWMPTGRLVVTDPGYLVHGSEDHAPLTVDVLPGDYAVQLAMVAWEPPGDGGEGDVEPVTEVAAARLVVSVQPTVAWELALRPGQDPRLLREDECFGFGVDSGTGCFVDEAGRDRLGPRYEGFVEPGSGGAFLLMEDEELECNLIAFCSGRGDGHYPVWIGRDAAGAVTEFVADMRLLDQDARILTDAAGTDEGG